MIIQDYQGQSVQFTVGAWQHIVGEHPEMAALQAEAIATVQFPDIVRGSNRNPRRWRLSYKWFDRTPVGDKWICAVVKYLDNGEAFVATAYATDRIKSGATLWSRDSG